IPAMTIKYREGASVATSQSAQSTVIEGELSTEPLTVQVVSALTGEVDPADLAHLRDIKGTVDVPFAHSWRRTIWMAVGLVVLMILGVVLYYRMKYRQEKAAPPIPPGTWAATQFRILEEERLIEQSLYHAFYSRLSDIV